MQKYLKNYGQKKIRPAGQYGMVQLTKQLAKARPESPAEWALPIAAVNLVAPVDRSGVAIWPWAKGSAVLPHAFLAKFEKGSPTTAPLDAA